jgi:DNA polymerase I-like protein with 3'-5' exonuclease and polymerase domains
MGSPAVQQMPSKSDLLRAGFTCEEDESIFTVDYASQEVRASAVISGDEQLIADLEAGINPIKRLSIETHGTDKGREYSATKNQIYAQSYGAGIDKLVKMTGMDEDVVRSVRDNWRGMYPRMYECSRELEELVKRQGYVIGIFGRPLIIPRGSAYKAFNMMAQNLGREIGARGVVNIYNSPWRHTLKLFMHDENVGAAKKHEVQAAMEAYKSAMTMTVQGMLFPVEAEETGSSWTGHYSDEDDLLMMDAIEEALAIS